MSSMLKPDWLVEKKSHLSSNLSIKVFETLDSLKALQSQWKGLEQRVLSKYYQSYNYNLAYYSILQDAKVSPYVISFWDEEKLVGIFPWEKRCYQKLGFSYCEIGSILHDHVTLTDILVEKNHLKQVANNFSKFLDSLPWSSLLTSCGTQESAGLITLLKNINKITILKNCVRKSFYLKYHDTDIDSELPKRMIKNVNRLLRKAEAESGSKPEFEFLSSSTLSLEAYNSFLEIETSGWKGECGSKTAIELDQKLKAFYAFMINKDPDSIQINLYKLEGKSIAAQYCHKDAQGLSLAKVAYREEYKNYSPGHVLIYKTIMNTFKKEKLGEISFVTDAKWLERWVPQEQEVYKIVFTKKLFFKPLVYFLNIICDARNKIRPAKVATIDILTTDVFELVSKSPLEFQGKIKR